MHSSEDKGEQIVTYQNANFYLDILVQLPSLFEVALVAVVGVEQVKQQEPGSQKEDVQTRTNYFELRNMKIQNVMPFRND